MPVNPVNPRKPAIHIVLNDGDVRLVRALSSQAALKHVTKSIVVRKATADDMESAFTAGAVVEEVTINETTPATVHDVRQGALPV